MMNQIRLNRNICLAILSAFVITLVLSTETQSAATVANDDFIIILDQSGSMREKTPGYPQQGYARDPMQAYKSRGAVDAINNVVGNILKEGDYFTLITFGDEPNLLLSQQILYKHERDFIKNTIEKLPFKDNRTDILAGIKEASEVLKYLDTTNRRKILVMITDGVEDPPKNSPYFSPEAKRQVYEELKDTIRFNKWDVVLVGIGEYTHDNIKNIAQKLDLPSDRAKTVNNPRDSKEISDILADIITDQQNAYIKLEKNQILIKLRPGLFGGYKQGRITLPLKSFFDEKIQVVLQTGQPVNFGSNELQVAVTPLKLDFASKATKDLNLDIIFKGKRPETGRVNGNFAFKFAEASTRFYPHDGGYEVILPSWWETHWLKATVGIVLALVLLFLAARAVRRALAPEIRIAVSSADASLGEAMTIRRKRTFSIANQQFEGQSVAAKGLACKTAATVQYLGRRKFKITARDAKLLYDGKERDSITLGLEQYFDLKDANGKTLSNIMITQAGRGSNDPFGGGSNDDPFKLA